MKFNYGGRIQGVSIGIIVFALVLITRLFFVQVIHGKAYSEKADRQFITPTSDVFDRGTVYFTKKDGKSIEAATMIEGYKVAVNGTEVQNAEAIYAKINPIVPLDRKATIDKASKKDDPYEEIATKISREKADKIISLKIPGVYVYKQKWRFYPGNDMASHAIGFVAFKGDVLAGRYGLERYYNDVLTRSEDNLYVNFFAEVFSNIEHTIFKNTGDSGDIVTTLEPTVQQYVQDSLNTVMTTWKSDAAGAIVMNPKDGSILAMAYTPTFDINQFGKVEDVKRFSNPLVENVFEFGSVVKPLVMAGALDAGVVTPATTYTDNGFVMVEGKKLNNFDKKGRGLATMQDVLTQSLNTGMVFVEQKMGKDTFRNYMTSYDLGLKTGIDLPNETQGLTANLKSPRNLEYATAAFGQGIALTPVELIRAFGSLANAGVMVTPHLMKSINYDEGGSEDFEGETKKTALKPETLPVITKMLTTIVDTGIGEGQYKMDHYSIAAKTGTAQIALPSGGGYYTDRNLHSLLGFFPAYNPEFVMLFFTVNPKGAGSDFAAGTLAKPYMDTVKFLLNYYEVPPDR